MFLTMPEDKFFDHLYAEDAVGQNMFYQSSLPREMVTCQLKVKDDMTLSGLHYFLAPLNFYQIKLF